MKNSSTGFRMKFASNHTLSCLFCNALCIFPGAIFSEFWFTCVKIISFSNLNKTTAPAWNIHFVTNRHQVTASHNRFNSLVLNFIKYYPVSLHQTFNNLFNYTNMNKPFNKIEKKIENRTNHKSLHGKKSLWAELTVRIPVCLAQNLICPD